MAWLCAVDASKEDYGRPERQANVGPPWDRSSMRATCSLYVDAGYLLAAAATRVTGTSLRKGIHVEFRDLITSLITQAEERCGLRVLRVHWYDSARNGVPDAQQERIGELAKVKLRLGRFGVDGQQKGVDLRIGLDLVAHARNGASDVFFLVSGDDDLTEAVEEAQVHGVEVVVLAVPNADGKPHSVSRHLVRASDELLLVPPEVIDRVVMKVEIPRPADDVAPAATDKPGHEVLPGAIAGGSGPTAPSPRDLATLGRAAPLRPPVTAVLAYSGSTGGPSHVLPGYEGDDDTYDEQIDAVVTKVLASFRQSATVEGFSDLLRSKPSIPRDVDRALLVDMADTLAIDDLPEPVRYRLRSRFWEHCER